MPDRRSLPRRLYWVLLHLGIVLAFSRFLIAPLVDRVEAGSTDFAVFYTGWSLVLHDPGHLYDVETQRRAQAEILQGRSFQGGVMTFYYPPHAAVVLAPLALLDFENAFRLWMALQLAAAVLLIRWLLELAGLERALDRWVLATAVLAFLPLLYALQIGQLSIAMVLALVGFWRAFERRQEARAGFWLLALTVKAQLIPVPLLLLIATRRFRPLAWMLAAFVPLAALASAVLGAGVWRGYPEAVRHLEGFVAGGSHDHMLNLRGWLTRIFGAGHDRAIVAVCLAALAGATVIVYRDLRRAVRDGVVPRLAFAAALAIETPLGLHLHMQDALVWVIPLVLFASYLRNERGDRRAFERFASFALAWPAVFVATRTVEEVLDRRLVIPPPLVLAGVLIAWIVRVRRVSGDAAPV